MIESITLRKGVRTPPHALGGGFIHIDLNFFYFLVSLFVSEVGLGFGASFRSGEGPSSVIFAAISMMVFWNRCPSAALQ